MIFKKLVLTAALSLSFLGHSSCSMPPEEPSRVPSLSAMCGQHFLKRILDEAGSDTYDTLDLLEERLNPESAENRTRISELVFANYESNATSDLVRRLRPYLKSFALKVKEEDQFNPKVLRVLTESRLLRNLAFVPGVYLKYPLLEQHAHLLADLTMLQDLKVPGNYLGENVRHLAGLAHLQILDVSYNDLGEHVRHLTSLTLLEKLDVSVNILGEHVRHLAVFTQLKDLNVGGNGLGEHVRHLTGLTQLKELNVFGNNLGEHMLHLAGLTFLKKLTVYGNKEEGYLPLLDHLRAKGTKIIC